MSTSALCTAGTAITSVTCTNALNVVTMTIRFTIAQTLATAMSFTLNTIRNYPTLAQYSIQV